MTLPPDTDVLTVIEATRNPLSNLVKGPRGGIQYLDDVSHTETTHTKTRHNFAKKNHIFQNSNERRTLIVADAWGIACVVFLFLFPSLHIQPGNQ